MAKKLRREIIPRWCE